LRAFPSSEPFWGGPFFFPWFPRVYFAITSAFPSPPESENQVPFSNFFSIRFSFFLGEALPSGPPLSLLFGTDIFFNFFFSPGGYSPPFIFVFFFLWAFFSSLFFFFLDLYFPDSFWGSPFRMLLFSLFFFWKFMAPLLIFSRHPFLRTVFPLPLTSPIVRREYLPFIFVLGTGELSFFLSHGSTPLCLSVSWIEFLPLPMGGAFFLSSRGGISPCCSPLFLLQESASGGFFAFSPPLVQRIEESFLFLTDPSPFRFP